MSNGNGLKNAEIMSYINSNSIQDYEVKLEKKDATGFRDRCSLLKAAKDLFKSEKRLSEMSDFERGVFLGELKELGHYEFEINHFGAPKGSGKVQGLITDNYKLLDDFFAEIPRQSRISEEQYLNLIELVKQAWLKTEYEKIFPFALFTRILAITRPDTFVPSASGVVNTLCTVFKKVDKEKINQVGTDPISYWENLLPLIHKKPLFEKGVGDINSRGVALLDCVLWENKNSDDSQKEDNQSTENDIHRATISSPLNQILYGPPGTGKTYHTIEAAVKAAAPDFVTDLDIRVSDVDERRKELKNKYDELVKNDLIRFVTFHQSYGYEEFVEGLRAKTDNKNQVYYVVERGVFKSICDKASEDLGNNYVLVIDEINRGNISKIFGELITLIEPSKRSGNDEALEVTLPNSGEPFSIPKNLHIIGTMNTADRSLAMMDTALRRRFDFKEMMPKPELFESCLVKGVSLTKLLDKMNKRIEVLYDREHMLGHAFLFPAYNAMDEGDEERAMAELKSAFQNKIIPLLQEYFYEDWSKIRLVLGDNQKSELQFVKEKAIEYKLLFGKVYQANEYEQPDKHFELTSFNDSMWSDPKAYQSIYSVLPKSHEMKEGNAGE